MKRLMLKDSKGQDFTAEELHFLEDGSRMLPGSDAHRAQCWVEYQFRNPRKYPRLSYTIAPEWERLYRSILENKGAGSAFEDTLLHTQGYQKNTVMMMPPPGDELAGFIADSVRGNPTELVWGQPYKLVECKARQELSLTGNLKAMIEYVKAHGGYLELWVRSAKHPEGATKLSGPLKKRLDELRQQGKAQIRSSP